MAKIKSDLSQKPTSGRSIPLKCKKCALLSAAQAKVLHGSDGDDCWNPKVCHSRRSYARHHDRIKQQRNRHRQETVLELPPADLAMFKALQYAILVVYREAGAESIVHAISAQVWQGQKRIAIIQPIHCVGLVPTQIHQYVKKLLTLLEENYEIRKFAALERLDPYLCPIRPCLHHLEVDYAAM